MGPPVPLHINAAKPANTEGAAYQTPLTTHERVAEKATGGQSDLPDYNSPRQEYILKMRASEEETLHKFRSVLRKIRHAMNRQRNISMDVQNGISELEELSDIIADYRKNWKKAEIDKQRSKSEAKKAKIFKNVETRVSTDRSSQKRTATSPAETTRPKKVQKEANGNSAQEPKKPKKAPKDKVTQRTEKEDSTHRKTKRPKMMRGRSDAVMVKPAAGHSYADVLRSLKEKVKPEEAEVAVRSVRRTKTGAILLELEKGGKKDEFCQKVRGTLGKAAEVKDMKPKVTVEIRDIEGSCTKEEVLAAIIRATELREEEVTIQLTNPNLRDQRRAFVSVPASGASRLLAQERIKIGWVSCRMRHLEEMKRCFRCFGPGHTQWNCKGPDRKGSGLCIRCGEKGHILKQCTNPPKCCLCSEKGMKFVDHIAGSRRCQKNNKNKSAK